MIRQKLFRLLLPGLLLGLLVVPSAGSLIALRAAAELPGLTELPEALPGTPPSELAFAAWCAYLSGFGDDALLEVVESALPATDDAAAAALSELAGLLRQRRGDYAEAFSHYAAFLRLEPGRPELFVYLERLGLLATEFPGGLELFEELCRQVIDDPAQSRELRFEAARLLIERYRRAGDPAVATALARSSGYLERFSFLGPFDNENRVGFDTAYGPEVDGRVDLSAAYPGRRVEVRWRELPRPIFQLGDGELRPFYGSLRLSGVAFPNTQACGYLVTYVRVPARRDVVLRLGTGGAYKLMLNGALIDEADLYRSWSHPDTSAVGVTLEAGWHEVLLKVCCTVGGWSASLRLTDVDGVPLELEHAPRPPSGWRRPAAPALFDPPADHYAELELLAAEDNALACFYLGHLEAAQRRADEDEQLHRELFRRAMLLSQDYPAGRGWPTAAYDYGLYETDFNRARGAYLRALELDPGYLEAHVALAELYANLHRPLVVLDYIAGGLELNPDDLRLLTLKEGQLAALEYQIERKAVLDRILELHPDYLPGLEALAGYAVNRFGLERRLEILARILELDATNDSALTGSYNLLVARGDVDEARRVLNEFRPRSPFEAWPLRFQANLLFGRGLYAEAVEVYDAALELRPDDAEMLARRARCLWELGRTEAAEADWDRALEIQPFLTWIDDYRRALREGPAADQFDAPYAVDVYALIDEWEARGELDPEASAEYLLDQQILRVNRDGTSSRVVHKVIKIKRAEALSDFGYGFFSYIPEDETYEIRHMRVIREDGSELEATDFAEYSRSNVQSRMYHDEYVRYAPLPGIEVGAVIDIQYRIDEVGANIYQGNFSRSFIFGNYQPTMRSEFIVITPEEYPLSHHLQGEGPAYVEERRDGLTVHRWIADDLPRVRSEPFAPELVELLPLVVVSNFREWDELGRWWWSLSRSTLEPTRAVRELAAELTADAETPFERLVAIYDYVTREIRYVAILLGIGGWKPIEPERTLNTGYGDCKATAALLIAMLDSVGIRAYPVLIRTSNRGDLDWEQAAIGLFNHMIIAVPFQEGIGPEQLGTRLSLGDEPHFDRFLFLDGVAEYHTWWELPEMDQGCQVYICTPQGGFFTRTPLYPPADNTLITHTRLVLDEEGDARGHRTLEYGANNNPGRRRDYQQLDRQQINLERYWNSRYPGALISEIALSDMDDMTRGVSFAYDMLLPSFAGRQGEMLSFASHLHHDQLTQTYGTLTERHHPLRLGRRWAQRTTVEYVLPPGYRPVGLPEDVSLEVRDDDGALLAAFDCRFTFAEGVVTVHSELLFDAPEINVGDYSRFRSFLAAFDRTQNLILSITGSAASSPSEVR